MNCPICGRELVQTDKALGCSGWQDGCDFVIWNTIAGHDLTDQEKEALILTGITEDIGDFKSKEGKVFSARLKLDDEKKVVFDFPDRMNPVDGKRCPLCGKPVYRSEKVLCCTDRECDFVIFNSMSGHFFTADEMEALYNGEEIGPFEDFISKSGKDFRAFVKLGDDGKTHFVFPKKEGDAAEMNHGEQSMLTGDSV